MLADLHTHSTASDGKLSPAELLARARAAGVEMLAITDHDSIAAYAELPVAADLRIVPGVEFSTWWQRVGIHIVGLNVDLNGAAMAEAIAWQHRARDERAVRIAERLAKRGIAEPLAGAARFAGQGSVGRPHFAEYLVSIGAAPNIEFAFRKYLDTTRIGNLIEGWASLPAIVEWIRAAGGTAVIAHPGKYKLTRSRLEQLTGEFAAAGGQAIEVVSGLQKPELTRDLAALAKRHGLAASVGSDFHQPGQVWAQLGVMPALPADASPVWDLWSL
ncbi:MAG: PHP domain-containing protein [Proteobacteria bacterium]|nr:PHP domain-containing protein [Pseudomonadota bacterium]MBK8960254.1 PHP domain-containing protein [Pseudomonadota bacterium]